ncbi:nSTAND1 domain-containing NTPase [Nonomuraea sp. NPDC001684]
MAGDLVLARNPAHRPANATSERASRDPRPPGPRICPYPGLAAFTREEAAWFFGRERQTADLTGRVAELYDSPAPLFVVGASGSGKSSLLQAGLLPAIARGELGVAGSSGWPSLLFTPTADPLGALAAQLAPLLGEDPAQVLRSGEEGELAQFWRTAAGTAGRVVVVVDQFEEIFTECPDPELRTRFIRVLRAGWDGAGRTPGALVVFGMRADFVGRCADHADLAPALARPSIIGPMSSEEARAAIERPAMAVGLPLEPGLADVLLNDLGALEAGRLPLLAHALRAGWQRSGGEMLTVEDYLGTGGIQGALAATADRVLAALDEPGRETGRRVLLRLIHLGEGADDTRRRVPLDRLMAELPAPDRVRAVVEAFADDEARLITLDEGMVQITHEALLSSWPVLQAWIEEDRAGLLVEQRLVNTAHEWERSGRDSGTLYSGARLALAREWADRQSEVGGVARSFLRESVRRARTRRLVRVWLGGALAVLASATLIAATALVTAEREAGVQRDFATSRRLIARIDGVMETDPTLARLLAVAAWKVSPEPAEALAAVRATALRPERAAWHLPVTVESLAFSRDGRLIATGGRGEDAGVRVWEVATGRLVLGPLGKGQDTWRVAFSPDGTTLASAEAEKLHLWDVSTGTARASTAIDRFGPLTFTPDGKAVAMTDGDIVRRWDTTTGEELGKPVKDPSQLKYLAFSPDGRTLATAGLDEVIALRDAATGKARILLRGKVNSTGKVTFSPDGRTIAAESLSGEVRLWDATTGDPLKSVPGGEPTFDTSGVLATRDSTTVRVHDAATGEDLAYPIPSGSQFSVMAVDTAHGTVATADDGTVTVWALAAAGYRGTIAHGPKDIWSMAFAPDGRTLATGGGHADSTIRLWDATSGAPIGTPVNTGTSGIMTLAFSPDGRKVVAGGSPECKGAGIWDVSGAARNPDSQGCGREHTGSAAAFSPDGRTVARVGATGGLQLDDVTTGQTRLALPSGPGLAGQSALAFSPDGRTLATGGGGYGDTTVRLWNVADGRLKSEQIGHKLRVNALAFSPDGRILASSGGDGVVRLWDVASGAPVRAPLQVPAATVAELFFSADGTLLLSEGIPAAHVWDVGTGRLLGLLYGHTSSTSAMAYSPRSKLVATTQNDGNVHLWDLSFLNETKVVPLVCAQAGRVLTRAEWQLYLPGVEFRRTC